MKTNRRIACVSLIAVAAASCASANVPAPYTPVAASPAEFRCLGRVVRLGRMLLPVQAVATGQPVLAAPVAIVADRGALTGLRGKGKVLSNDGNAATLEWTGESAGFRVTSHMTAECDGFCWYEITLSPKRLVRLSSLKLEIPRAGATARYLHTAAFTWGTFSQGLKEHGGNWSGRFMPYIWLGDERRGFAWCCESDQGWHLEVPANALRVVTTGDRVLFTSTFIDHEMDVAAPITLRFGLQPTPVKPVSLAWQKQTRLFQGIGFDVLKPGDDGRVALDVMREAGVRAVVFQGYWTDYLGKVSTPWGDRLRDLIAECHRRGLKLLVGIGYGLARKAPEIQGHHDAWSVMPLMPWEMPNGDNVNFDVTCARSGWADWLVAGIDRLFADYDLDGLYCDGTSEAFSCQNELHGCGWRDEKGVLHPTFPLLARRSLMRRIAEIVHRHRPDGIVDVHMSANLTMPTLSFCDSYWDGEQYETHTAAEKFEVPLHVFRTEFMGYAHGLNGEFLCYRNQPFTFPEAIALAWLHNVEVRPLYLDDLRYVVPIWHAMDAFGADTARWLPYWDGSGAESSDETVKASAFVREGKALIFVSHLARTPVRTGLRLDRRKLGLGSGPLAARDALTGATVEMDGDRLPVSFDGLAYRLVEVSATRRR